MLTTLLRPLFLRRARVIETYAAEAHAIQRRQLCQLIRTARQTEWGHVHCFDRMPVESDAYEAFRRAVPVSTYEDLQPYIRRMIDGQRNVLWPGTTRWFAQSSGTTDARSKYIPVTPDILRRAHYAGGFDTVALYLRNSPRSRFFDRKGLILGGSHSPSPLNARAHCGDLSAVLLQNLNPLVNLVRVPSRRIILMDEWEAKIRAIVRSTRKAHVGSLSGIPSWMLVLIEAVIRDAGAQTLLEVWPDLEVFFHGGVGFEPYRNRYARLIPSSDMRYMETYNASEGFFGLQSEPTDRSLLLMLDYGIFYECIPTTALPTDGSPIPPDAVLPLEEVRTGENYALVITTAGGLWRYLIGDTIRFTSLRPYKFLITGRTKHFINAFGEELMVDNAERAIRQASEATSAAVRAYTAAPLYLLTDRAKGRHRWLIEFDTPPTSLPAFAAALDTALQAFNSDYAAKRYKEISLQPPEIIPARPGLFFDWLRSHGKLGGQHKVPPLSNTSDLMDELLAMNGTKATVSPAFP